MKKAWNSENEKVLALYQAVIALIEEDADINTLKVVDITQKAGIGKGTAYEYFNSKEEMIVQALLYDIQTSLRDVKKRIASADTLEKQIGGVFDWIEQIFARKRTSVQFFRISNHSYEVGEPLQKELDKMQENHEEFYEILAPIVEMGKQEGKISPDMPLTLIYMILIPGFISFFMYMTHLEHIPDVTTKEVKAFLYKNMIQSLQSKKY